MCNRVYLGETRRHYQVRVFDHLGISIKTDNGLAYNVKSATAVRKHSHDLGHASGAENFKTSFLRKRHEMSQVEFQDFSDFAPNAYLSTLGESTSKNHNPRFSVTMFKKL